MAGVWFFLIASMVLMFIFIIGLAVRRYRTGNDLSERFDPSDWLWWCGLSSIGAWILMFVVRYFVG